MKFLSCIIILLSTPFIAVSQTDSLSTKQDIVKKGWNVGPIPFVAYDSDLGFEYGLVLNFFDYGTGINYPQYNHSIYTEVSRFTKGSGVYRLSYDSKSIIPGIRFTSDILYAPNLAADFFGFNGSESIFHKDWIDTKDSQYRSKLFYKMNSDLFRVFADFQGSLGGSNSFKWVLGTGFYSYDVGNVDIDKLNAPESEYGAQNTLYSHYADWGLIGDWERSGGQHFAVKAGLTYDTRDNEPNPMKGIWCDVLSQYFTPNLSKGHDGGYAKITTSFRQYFTLIPDNLSFCYRVLQQNVLAGRCPFYMLPTISTVSLRRSNFEGLGGSQTLRGVYRNRIVGKGILFANAEFRYKFWRFRMLNQNIYCAINAFFDSGIITEKVDVAPDKIPADIRSDFYNSTEQGLHYSTGIGGKVVLNQNFVISGEIGKALRKEDGDIGIYIGANFLF